MSAHPKVDPVTGELLSCSCSRQSPYLRCGFVDEADALVHCLEVLLNGFSLSWDEEPATRSAFVLRFHRDRPHRGATGPRRGERCRCAVVRGVADLRAALRGAARRPSSRGHVRLEVASRKV
ncbi:MAG: hypothetical protein M3Y71_01880 [Actinomycetota bacterium]|nr:hypothetical protein [Actinomycetota bacterium]